jgi:hypothetical protein
MEKPFFPTSTAFWYQEEDLFYFSIPFLNATRDIEERFQQAKGWETCMARPPGKAAWQGRLARPPGKAAKQGGPADRVRKSKIAAQTCERKHDVRRQPQAAAIRAPTPDVHTNWKRIREGLAHRHPVALHLVGSL